VRRALALKSQQRAARRWVLSASGAPHAAGFLLVINIPNFQTQSNQYHFGSDLPRLILNVRHLTYFIVLVLFSL
jgi:hypothetical protein